MLEISAISVMAIAVFWTPVVILALSFATNRAGFSNLFRLGLALLICAVGYAIPLYDVTVNTIAFRHACSAAGVRIYEKVTADGVYTNVLGRDALERREFSFLEVPDGNGVMRYERTARGEITSERYEIARSRYELVLENWIYLPASGVERLAYTLLDRSNKKIIAERIMFMPRHGWLDRILLVGLFGENLSACRGQGGDDFHFYLRALHQPALQN